ncbi:PREDICTED: inducible T-cell costimulator isoform X1 [Chinchilla lanigera]|uniref:Inducible T-cell costimulator n=1 Tax=Chinchilla lanigera TaxID=34839 RepID=A0A8C2UZH9_CHILA|nr:PREDICTED: inducible T-cell costimulator isoform X1 [Chinchilla lanigera]
MKSGLWYLFVFCFQVKVLAEEINDTAKYEMFTFHHGGVQVLCKYPETVQQFKMQLLKGRNILCDLSKTKDSGNKVFIQNQIFCQLQLSNNSVSFFLNNLDSSHGSYYSCNISIFDPPPFRQILTGEYLHIYESQLCCQLKFWLPIGCAAFVIVYTCGCILIFQIKKKKYGSSVHDPNSEYMFMAAVNTAKKPRLTDVTS